MNRFITTDFFNIIQVDRELERRRRSMVQHGNCIAIGTNPMIGGNNSIAIGGNPGGNINIGVYPPTTNYITP